MPSAQPLPTKFLTTLIPWGFRQWLLPMCFSLLQDSLSYQQTSKVHCSGLTFSDLISKDILPYFNALSTPKIIPWSLSTALIHKFILCCKLLILWAYSLIYSHYTFLMSTLESQVQWSITFSLFISISPIFTFLPIQVISGGPKFQTISCYILNSSCLTVL